MAYVPPLNGGRINATISGNTAGAGALISTGNMVLAGGNNVTLSQNSNTISISAPAISSVNAAGIVNISSAGSNVTISAPAFSAGIASNSTVTNQMILTAGNNITLSQSTNATGATVTVSAASQSNQTLGFYGTGGTFNNTTLTADARSLSFSGMGNVSVGYSNGMLQISGAGGGGSINFSAGTTSNNLASITFSNSNGVSFGLNGSTITGSIATSLTNVNLSAGTTSNNLSNMVFSNSNGVSFGLSGSTVTGSVAAQSAQTLGLYATGANTIGQSSSSTMDARSLNISGQGAVSVGLSGSTLQISAPTQTAQTQSNIQALYDGANSISTGTVRLSNANGISFGVNGQTITASHNALTSQTNQTIAFTAGTTGGANTSLTSTGTFDARSMYLNAYGNISAGFSSSSMFISATQSNQALSGSNGSFAFQTATFGNLNGLSFYSSNGSMVGSYTVPSQSAQTVGLYATGANTIGQSSSSTMDARSLNISGQGALSAGLSGSTLQLSAPATSSLSATGAFSISTNGATISMGAPAISSLSVTGGLNLSTNGSTISIGAPMVTQYIHNSAGMYASGTGAITNNSATIVRMFIPNAISFTRVDLPVSISVGQAANNSTAPVVVSRTGVIYTRSGSTLTPIAGSTDNGQYTFSSNNTGSVAGAKIMSVPVATTLAAGEYYLGVQLASAVPSTGGATTNLGWTISPIFGSYQQPAWDYMNVTTALTNNAFQPMQGLMSSISNTTQTIQQSNINQGGTSGNRGNLVVMFKNDYIGE